MESIIRKMISVNIRDIFPGVVQSSKRLELYDYKSIYTIYLHHVTFDA